MTVEEYIHNAPVETREKLIQMRALVLESVPELTEYIGYGMPGYKYKGKVFLYFAAFKNHIGFYALPKVYEEFADKLSKYKTGKGSVQFPLNQELPVALIKEIIQFKLNQVTNKTQSK